MALPIIATPTYETVIPSTDKPLKYRPFLVKEEKALLIAQQSENAKTMIDTLKSVIKSCTFDELNVNDLAIFDIEYIFSQIRSKSVGEIVSLIFKCGTCTDEKARVKHDIDLSKLQVSKPEGHTKNIQLFGDVGIVMKYPTIDIISQFDNMKKDDVESIFKIVCSCIDFVYSGEEIHYTKDQKKEDIEQFVNNLTQDQFKLLQNFFETMPKLKHDVHYDCPICNVHHHEVLQGLDSFFS